MPPDWTFVGTDGPLGIATLLALLQHEARPRAVVVPGVAPGAVVPGGLRVSAPSGVADVAADAGIRVVHAGSASDAALRAALADLAPQLVVVACLGVILQPATLAAAECGFLNVHPSWLPAYRGPAPMFWQLRDGRATGGVSVHRMTAQIDGGPLLLRAQFELPAGISEGRAEALAGAAGGARLAGALANWPPAAWIDQRALQGGSAQRRPDARAFVLDARTWTAARAWTFMRATAWRSRIYTVDGVGWRAELTDGIEVCARRGDRPHVDGHVLLVPFAQDALLAHGRLIDAAS